jgi:hypothetical protein
MQLEPGGTRGGGPAQFVGSGRAVERVDQADRVEEPAGVPAEPEHCIVAGVRRLQVIAVGDGKRGPPG